MNVKLILSYHCISNQSTNINVDMVTVILITNVNCNFSRRCLTPFATFLCLMTCISTFNLLIFVIVVEWKGNAFQVETNLPK